ncbi:MAG: DUF3300 domain-containing protein [Candidatus Acidiferrales bacterium]
MTLFKQAFASLTSFALIVGLSPVSAAELLQQQAAAQQAPGNDQNSNVAPEDNYAPLTAEELDGVVAPIALYPDALVAQVLGAASFPDQITDASFYLRDHPDLKGDALAQSVDGQDWDPAVKALTQFPTVLDQLARNLAWTSTLGEASAMQQSDVMAAIQRMRAKAYESGNLKSSSEIKVVQQAPQTIVIQPANPQVIYVPQYNPTVIYGAPVVVPSYTYYPPSSVATTAIISFGAGIAIGAALSSGCGGWGWGWGCWGTNWGGNTIVFNRNVYYGNPYWRGGYYRPYRPGYPSYGRPPYYRPPSHPPGHGRPPGNGRPPNPPPGGGRPPTGGRPPNPPGNGRPPYVPGQPNPGNPGKPNPGNPGKPNPGNPGTRPPGNRPSPPTIQPVPTPQPGKPGTRPSPGAPSTRPSPGTPTAQPMPSTRPSTQPNRGYPQTKPSGPAPTPSAQPGAFSSGSRPASVRGNQSLNSSNGGANRGGKPK